VLVLAMTGLLVEICFVGMALLRDLLENMVPFLALDCMACLSYGTAVYSLLRGPDGRRMLPLILGLAILFRVTLLFITPPTLSSDVYRYIWDGRMMNVGVNPYAHPVDSPLLDRFDSPQRALVNHSWMASPYLPVAQAFFAVVYRLAPDSPLSFQVAAALLDLLTGLLVIDLLHRLGLPRTWVLIYLWNPLVVVEFAHGAHLDALMICLVMAAFWLLIARMSASAMSASAMSASAMSAIRARSAFLSAVALAAATLTKGLPALLLPVLARWWGCRRVPHLSHLSRSSQPARIRSCPPRGIRSALRAPALVRVASQRRCSRAWCRMIWATLTTTGKEAPRVWQRCGRQRRQFALQAVEVGARVHVVPGRQQGDAQPHRLGSGQCLRGHPLAAPLDVPK
jgi:hypothetical protein